MLVKADGEDEWEDAGRHDARRSRSRPSAWASADYRIGSVTLNAKPARAIARLRQPRARQGNDRLRRQPASYPRDSSMPSTGSTALPKRRSRCASRCGQLVLLRQRIATAITKRFLRQSASALRFMLARPKLECHPMKPHFPGGFARVFLCEAVPETGHRARCWAPSNAATAATSSAVSS